jgi:hypothetical protein
MDGKSYLEALVCSVGLVAVLTLEPWFGLCQIANRSILRKCCVVELFTCLKKAIAPGTNTTVSKYIHMRPRYMDLLHESLTFAGVHSLSSRGAQLRSKSFAEDRLLTSIILC